VIVLCWIETVVVAVIFIKNEKKFLRTIKVEER
jgi:hypothetical protein